MAKDSEWSGLLKVPSEVVISELRIKLGQQNAYISELEDKVKALEGRKIKETKLSHLETEVTRLTAKLKDAQNRLVDVSQRNRILETEILKQLKKDNEKTT
jgi:uncharacterized coiled-coil protein SlyX